MSLRFSVGRYGLVRRNPLKSQGLWHSCRRFVHRDSRTTRLLAERIYGLAFARPNIPSWGDNP